jgi:DNA mismatch repair protein MutS
MAGISRIEAAATPAMRQYLDAKQRYRDAIVLFRMGDFYEMFYGDALAAARALELTLTSRSRDGNGNAIPMCGVPHHAVDGYIARLVRKGYRVAICEQMEDPRKAKGLVRREVVKLVSPGTLVDANYLEAREPAFLLAIAPPPGWPSAHTGARDDQDGDEGAFGTALLDLSTGEFTVAEYAGPGCAQALEDEIALLQPREIVTAADLDVGATFPAAAAIPVSTLDPWLFDTDTAKRALLEQFHTASLEGYGLEPHVAAVRAAGALIQYLRDTQKADLAHVRSVSLRGQADCLQMDPSTFRHLEIVEAAGGGRDGSLLHEIDRTTTAMGARMLRSWLMKPLVALERIQDRLDAVEEFAFHTTDRGRLRETLKSVQDIERLVARIALGSAGPRDLVALRHSIAVVPRVRLLMQELGAPLIKSLLAELDDLPDVRDLIARTIADEPPAQARDGGAIRDGVDAELDELRAISRSGKQRIAEMEETERRRTGIGTLKIRYNRVFGYYIEVSKSQLGAVPPEYHRKQTIAGGERFITPGLKEWEDKVLGADERMLERELELFEALRSQVAAEAARIQDSARALATLDTLAGLAETAAIANFVKPHVHDGDEMAVVDGRHPVVERRTPGAFVANDVLLNASTQQLMILTGPNMGGKSTYLRQTALLSVLAQSGSFVPARSAKLPVVDRVFARVGASDNIARGQSTFMVEMQETANILHTATSRSLVLLDEIGRGTSTYDGLSIAWAVAEHLASAHRGRPKTLFATHYHELTDLADSLPGVVNFHVVAREWHDEIVFLRKVSPGRSDRSYGIQVARLAGLPPSVVARAREILGALEADELARGGRPSPSDAPARRPEQPGLFEQVAPADDGLRRRLRGIDPDRLTPMEALMMLAELKKDADI